MQSLTRPNVDGDDEALAFCLVIILFGIVDARDAAKSSIDCTSIIKIYYSIHALEYLGRFYMLQEMTMDSSL